MKWGHEAQLDEPEALLATDDQVVPRPRTPTAHHLRGAPPMTTAASEPSPPELIDARIAGLGDWRGEMLARIRRLIKKAEPEVVEEWKWRGVPTWYRDGMICTGETYEDKVKVTFAKGASLPDPTGLFNASLNGNVRRAIDVREGDELDEAAFLDLVRAAVHQNTAKDVDR